MTNMKSLYLSLVTVVILMLCVSTKAQSIDSTTEEQLRLLLKLCNNDLITPEMCREKQRAILGLQTTTKSTEALPTALIERHTSTTDRLESDASEPHALDVKLKLPPGWIQVTAEEVQIRRETLMKKLASNPDAKNLLKHLESSSNSAANRYFHNDGDTLQIGRLALTFDSANSEKICQSLSGQVLATGKISDKQNAALPLPDCGIRQVGGSPALYVEKHSVRDDTRVIQLLVAKSVGETLQFILRCKTERVNMRKRELEQIVASIQ